MKKVLFHTFVTGALVIGMVGSAVAAIATMGADGSTRFRFGGRFEPTIVCKPLTVCDVTLETGEKINNIAVGDSSRWMIVTALSGPQNATSHLLIKPTAEGLATNLIVTTDKRTYFLKLRSSDHLQNSRISFSYPDEERAAAIARIRERADATAVANANVSDYEPSVPADKLDANFVIRGADEIRPDRVFTDGVKTFIEWRKLPNDLPAVYVSPRGSGDQLVNFRVHDNFFIVDTVARDFTLVLNAGTGRHGRGILTATIHHR